MTCFLELPSVGTPPIAAGVLSQEADSPAAGAWVFVVVPLWGASPRIGHPYFVDVHVFETSGVWIDDARQGQRLDPVLRANICATGCTHLTWDEHHAVHVCGPGEVAPIAAMLDAVFAVAHAPLFGDESTEWDAPASDVRSWPLDQQAIDLWRYADLARVLA